jgi:tetratricopeptide (TPR) repeat protein
MSETDSAERKKLNSNFLLIGGAILFWTVCVSLSQQLGAPPPAQAGSAVRTGPTMQNGGPAKEAEPPPLPESLKPLEERALKEPQNIEALTAYSEALITEGIKNSDPALLMRAVATNSQILNLDPKNKDALIGMASLAFENGVFDKAKGYYERYLEIVPTDLKAKTDYSLTLIQVGEGGKAKEILNELLKVEPNSFATRLSLALAHKVTGDKDAARQSATIALSHSPDENGKKVVEQFLANLDKPEDIMAPAPGESPAIAIDSFFRNHQILGPKVEKISWKDQSTVEIVLNQFPMEQMPPFAKEKLKKSIGEVISRLPGDIVVKFLAAEDSRVLFEERFSGAAK